LLPFWVQELHPQTRKRVVGRSAALTPAIKQSAVIELCMREGSARSVAEELGVSRPSLYTWKNQLLGHDAPASMKRKQDLQPSPELAELEQQAAALRQEVRRLRLEQDLLKKTN
jgi:transposase-like protein